MWHWEEVINTGQTIKTTVFWSNDTSSLECYALLDTGASCSFLPEAMVEEFGIPYVELTNPVPVILADGSLRPICRAAEVNVQVGGELFHLSALIMPCPELTFGYDFHHTILGMVRHRDMICYLASKPSVPIALYHIHTRWLQKTNLPQRTSEPCAASGAVRSHWDVEQLIRGVTTCKFVNFVAKVAASVPPGMVKKISVIPSSDFKQALLVQNAKVSKVNGLLVQNQTQYPNQSDYFIWVSNFMSFPIRVQAGEHLADGQEVQSIHSFDVQSRDKKVTKVFTPKEEELCEPLSTDQQARSFLSNNYNSLVVNDGFRLMSKNKQPELYPRLFNESSAVCQRMAEYEGIDLKRMPEYVQDCVHRNKNPDLKIEEFDFTPFNVNRASSPSQQQSMERMIFEFRDLFIYSKQELGNLDRSRLPKIKVETRTEEPVSQPPYRRSLADRTIIEDMVNEMLEAGIIRESESPYSSPVVIVSKKDGSKRFCVDYKKLNDISVRDVYPLPLISDALDTCSGSSWFSTLDLFSGYHLLPMDEESIPKTAFVCHMGLFEWLVLPFGLSSAPAKFQKLMDRVLARLRFKTCFIYLDDIICFARTFEEHQSRLREILATLNSVNLKLNPKKCFFIHEELEYLGNVINKHGIRPSPAKMEKVKNHLPPKNVKQVRQFLGLVGYFRSFIKNFAQIAKPLNDLLHLSCKFVWTAKEQHAFETLRDAICCNPIRTHFREDCEHEIHTDASGLGLGAVLYQKEKDEDGKDVKRVVAYWARGLRDAEKRYQATELELLAVVEALEHFRVYVHGRHFTVVSDHQALLALNKGTLCNSKHGNRRLIKWRLLLQDFDFDLKYTKGSLHFVPDCFIKNGSRTN